MEPSPQSTLTTLVDELRTVGVGVSVGEHLDAARALANIPLTDRAVVRATLQCALVKRTEHLDAFNLLFDLHFSGTNQPDSRPLAALADSELEPALRAAMRSGDTEMLRMLAEEYVRRFSRLEPGSPVAGVFALIAASEAANLDALRDELIAAAGGVGNGEGEGAGDGAGVGEGNGSGGGGGSGGGWRSQSPAIQARLDQAEADRAVDGFRSELQAAIRRTLVADRGARAVTKTMRIRLAEDVNISNASAAEQKAMLASIGPLAHRLSKILAQQTFRKRRLSACGGRCIWRWEPAVSRSASAPSPRRRPGRNSSSWPTCPARSPRSRGSRSTC